jgi:hypothetical protein
MNTRPRLPAVILFAIILSGGFGVARMTFYRHDLIGMSTIIVALALTVVYKRLATSRHPHVRIAMGNPQSKWPIALASVASDSFEIFPGRPEGYVGYTDYTAMSVDVNDDLATRQPAQQYALLGFGNGFLQGVRSRLPDVEGSCRTHFHIIDGSQQYKELIGWLTYLQRSGTDNAGPSTENLHSVIQSVASAVGAKGPITMKFWDKVHKKQSESLDASGTSREMLREWTEIYDTAFVEGQRQARDAAVVTKPI